MAKKPGLQKLLDEGFAFSQNTGMNELDVYTKDRTIVLYDNSKDKVIDRRLQPPKPFIPEYDEPIPQGRY